MPASNFSGSGALPVGRKQGISPWGSYDMAGNVKEWAWNEAEPGKRYVLGGAWDEPEYMFTDPDAQSPFLRASNIGFRCAKYIGPESIPQAATDPGRPPRRDLSKDKPVSDELFRAIAACIFMTKHPWTRRRSPGARTKRIGPRRRSPTRPLTVTNAPWLTVPSQTSQTTIPDGPVLSRRDCLPATDFLAHHHKSFGRAAGHAQERTRRAVPRVQGQL
jgi:hypothetical protein